MHQRLLQMPTWRVWRRLLPHQGWWQVIRLLHDRVAGRVPSCLCSRYEHGLVQVSMQVACHSGMSVGATCGSWMQVAGGGVCAGMVAPPPAASQGAEGLRLRVAVRYVAAARELAAVPPLSWVAWQCCIPGTQPHVHPHSSACPPHCMDACTANCSLASASFKQAHRQKCGHAADGNALTRSTAAATPDRASSTSSGRRGNGRPRTLCAGCPHERALPPPGHLRRLAGFQLPAAERSWWCPHREPLRGEGPPPRDLSPPLHQGCTSGVLRLKDQYISSSRY